MFVAQVVCLESLLWGYPDGPWQTLDRPGCLSRGPVSCYMIWIHDDVVGYYGNICGDCGPSSPEINDQVPVCSFRLILLSQVHTRWDLVWNPRLREIISDVRFLKLYNNCSYSWSLLSELLGCCRGVHPSLVQVYSLSLVWPWSCHGGSQFDLGLGN